MKITIRSMLVAASALLVAAACTDPTVAPKSSVSSANIFSEETSYKSFLAKIYAGLAVSGQQGPAGNGDISGLDEGFSQYMRLWWQMEELPTDEAAVSWNDGPIQELNTQIWSASNSFLGSMYYRIYFQVSMANEFLRETTPEKLASRNVSAGTRAEVAKYRAEARFLRALSYWHGMDLFGNIPIVKETDVVGKEPPAQATRAEVYNYVVSELTAIRSELPNVGAAEYGRVDQGAVAMLLAKVYLNAQVYAGTAKYAEALAEAQKVIAGPYRLDANFRRMFSADNNTSPEIIFAIQQDGDKIQTWGGMTFLIHASVGASMNAGDFGIDGGWWGIRTKPSLAALYPNPGPNSPDKRASFFVYNGFSGSMTNLTDYTTGIGSPKFTNKTSTGASGKNSTFVDTDFPVFRLADAYLIYAEAVVRGAGGSRATALGYINALRDRAYGNTSGQITDAQMTQAFILDERARELFWEGTRRTDLIRYGQYSTAGVWQWKGGTVNGAVTAAFRDLYPLPASELIANPKLKQNTGY
ncbi:MAG: RagB/SusD family nutrient uptake outer membrane protein [Gemmatimonadetes bacterium]|nr:RagB/SusD family nutrient uptake outer membrane protein [Gemmatimonadota bacterium]